MRAKYIFISILFFSMVFSDTVLNIDNYGEPIEPLSARLIAMGFVNIGIFSGSGLSHLNPACTSANPSTSFVATFYRDQNTYNISSIGSTKVAYNLPYISLDLKLPFGGVISISYLIRYDWGYKVSKAILDGEEQIGTAYGYGDGDVSTYSLSYSIGISKLLFGTAFDYYKGDPKYIWTKEFTKENYSDVRDVIEHRISGVGLRFGTGYHSKLIDAGFYLNCPLKMNLTRVVSNVEGELTEKDGDIKYPVVIGFGTSFRPQKMITVGFDMLNTRWSRFKIFGKSDSRLRNTTEFRLGFEFQPPIRDKKMLLLMMPARFGFYYKPWYSMDIDGSRYNERGITFGTGLIFTGNENSSVDFACHFGWRRGGVLSENIYRLYFTFNGIEKWIGKYVEED
ncbi:MAG: hypothetical protein ACUVWP_09600 [bacterium]